MKDTESLVGRSDGKEGVLVRQLTGGVEMVEAKFKSLDQYIGISQAKVDSCWRYWPVQVRHGLLLSCFCQHSGPAHHHPGRPMNA